MNSSTTASAAVAWRPPDYRSPLSRLVTVLRDPAYAILIVAVLTTTFLILYPLFWLLLHGGFSYIRRARARHCEFSNCLAWDGHSKPPFRHSWNDADFVLIAVPLVWITSRTDTPLRGVIKLAALALYHAAADRRRCLVAISGAARRCSTSSRGSSEQARPGGQYLLHAWTGLCHGTSSRPYVFLTVKAVMDRMDSRLEEASQIAGGDLWRTMRYIVLPLCMPGILSAAILVFTRSLEEFAIPGILRRHPASTRSPLIFFIKPSATHRRYEIAALLATFIMGANRSRTRPSGEIARRPATLHHRVGQRPSAATDEARRQRYVTLAYAMTFPRSRGAVALRRPDLCRLHQDLGQDADARQPNLAHFATTFSPEFDATTGTEQHHLGVRWRYRRHRADAARRHRHREDAARSVAFLEFVTAIPLMMPGPVMAVACCGPMLARPLCSTALWILLLAYITHYLPYGVRTITGSLRQPAPEI